MEPRWNDRGDAMASAGCDDALFVDSTPGVQRSDATDRRGWNHMARRRGNRTATRRPAAWAMDLVGVPHSLRPHAGRSLLSMVRAQPLPPGMQRTLLGSVAASTLSPARRSTTGDSSPADPDAACSRLRDGRARQPAPPRRTRAVRWARTAGGRLPAL